MQNIPPNFAQIEFDLWNNPRRIEFINKILLCIFVIVQLV